MSRKFSHAEKHRELVREVLYRRKLYAKLVEHGDMKADDAEYRIALMSEIADQFLELATKNDEPRFPDSFQNPRTT